MNWNDFVTWCGKSDIWASNITEHNRYLKPPPGVSITKWCLMLLKLKYEYRAHRPNSEDLEE